jgi:hypothetical protein
MISSSISRRMCIPPFITRITVERSTLLLHHHRECRVSAFEGTPHTQNQLIRHRGGILIALLRLIEPFRIPQTGGFSNALNVHRFIESLKFAFAARSEVTDPAFVKDPSRLDRFWKTDWADEVRAKITDVSKTLRPVDSGRAFAKV